MRTVDVIPLFTLIKQAVHLTSYCFKYDFLPALTATYQN